MTPPDRTRGIAYRVVVACPQPSHELVVPVDETESDPEAAARDIVRALLSIGPAGIADLEEVGYAEQVETVRSWYRYHRDLTEDAPVEVTSATPDRGASK